MKEGPQNLAIGLVFLPACLAVSNALIGRATGTFPSLTRESLTIAAWVPMWRPIRICLYDWWPLRRPGRVCEKLSHTRRGPQTTARAEEAGRPYLGCDHRGLRQRRRYGNFIAGNSGASLGVTLLSCGLLKFRS